MINHSGRQRSPPCLRQFGHDPAHWNGFLWWHPMKTIFSLFLDFLNILCLFVISHPFWSSEDHLTLPGLCACAPFFVYSMHERAQCGFLCTLREFTWFCTYSSYVHTYLFFRNRHVCSYALVRVDLARVRMCVPIIEKKTRKSTRLVELVFLLILNWKFFNLTT